MKAECDEEDPWLWYTRKPFGQSGKQHSLQYFSVKRDPWGLTGVCSRLSGFCVNSSFWTTINSMHAPLNKTAYRFVFACGSSIRSQLLAVAKLSKIPVYMTRVKMNAECSRRPIDRPKTTNRIKPQMLKIPVVHSNAPIASFLPPCVTQTSIWSSIIKYVSLWMIKEPRDNFKKLFWSLFSYVAADGVIDLFSSSDAFYKTSCTVHQWMAARGDKHSSPFVFPCLCS